MSSSKSERFFANPYEDLNASPNAAIKADQLVNELFWREEIKRIAWTCITQVKAEPRGEYCDGGLYTGSLGLIFMCNQLLERGIFTEAEREIKAYVARCLSANEKYYSSTQLKPSKEYGFLSGMGGLLAMGCFVAKMLGNQHDMKRFAHDYAKMAPILEPIDYINAASEELFVGRAGYLCGALCLKNYLNYDVLPQKDLFKLCDSIIESGKRYSRAVGSPCPLMFAYHGTEYLGSAHGLAGIFQILLSFPEYLNENHEAHSLLKQSVDFVLSLQKPNGNFPIAMDDATHAQPRHDSKELVHWCHGSGGVIFMLAKAFLTWREQKYLTACLRCGELIWSRGLLKKGPGICHGVAGNGLVHLMLYRLTDDVKYLHRAVKFAEFLNADIFKREARTPDCPYSLFEGWAGTVCFLIDLLEPKRSEFPLMPIF